MNTSDLKLVRKIDVMEDGGGPATALVYVATGSDIIMGASTPVEPQEYYYLEGQSGINSLGVVSPGVFKLTNTNRIFRKIEK